MFTYPNMPVVDVDLAASSANCRVSRSCLLLLRLNCFPQLPLSFDVDNNLPKRPKQPLKGKRCAAAKPFLKLPKGKNLAVTALELRHLGPDALLILQLVNPHKAHGFPVPLRNQAS